MENRLCVTLNTVFRLSHSFIKLLLARNGLDIYRQWEQMYCEIVMLVKKSIKVQFPSSFKFCVGIRMLYIITSLDFYTLCHIFTNKTIF